MHRYLQILETANEILTRLTLREAASLGSINYGVDAADPKRYTGNKPLLQRRTDARGNLIGKKNPKAWSASRKLTHAAVQDAQAMIMNLEVRPEGVKIEIMGKERDGKPRSVFIKKARKLGRVTYLSMSGKEVELKAAGTGLQVLDKASRRILLDRGYDFLWD